MELLSLRIVRRGDGDTLRYNVVLQFGNHCAWFVSEDFESEDAALAERERMYQEWRDAQFPGGAEAAKAIMDAMNWGRTCLRDYVYVP